MSKKQIIFKIIEHKPSIPNINEYNYQIVCNDTQFKDYIYFNKNNEVIDTTSLKKTLKYIIKLTKNGKILGVGNIILNQDFFAKKVKRKIYNINLFVTDNNYKKIFSQSFGNKNKQGIIVSIEIFINYNINEKEKEKGKGSASIQKKIKLIKRNLSFQNNNEYSVKSSNNYLTTSTSNINTYNNLNNCYDSDNFTDNNLNLFSPEKFSIITPSNAFSPSTSNNLSSPFSEPNLKAKKKTLIKKGIISSISFKNDNKKNKALKIFSNNIKNNIFDLKNKLNSSRNKKFIFNKNKINVIMTQESSSSKISNSNISQSSIIDSALIEKEQEKENYLTKMNLNKSLSINIDINDDIFSYIKNNENKDNEEINFYLNEIEKKKNRIFKEQIKKSEILFQMEENEKKLIKVCKNYEKKIENNKCLIEKMRENIISLNNKENIIIDSNKELTPIITEVKKSKEIENDIIDILLKNNENIEENKNKNIIENNLQKYNKNLMIKMIKNVIQNNHDIDSYLNDEHKKILKNICNKYNIFGSIIEDVEE